MQLIRPTQLTHPSRNQRRALALATSAFLSLAAIGCQSDGPMAPGLGSGTLTATGAVSVSASGLALFQSASSGGTSLFQVLVAPLSQGATGWTLQIANYSGRLEAGTYALSPLSASSPDPTANFYYTSGGDIQSFNSTSGQLVITASSPSEVRGTFTFTAADVADAASTVNVQGSFIAPCALGTTCQ